MTDAVVVAVVVTMMGSIVIMVSLANTALLAVFVAMTASTTGGLSLLLRIISVVVALQEGH